MKTKRDHNKRCNLKQGYFSIFRHLPLWHVYKYIASSYSTQKNLNETKLETGQMNDE